MLCATPCVPRAGLWWAQVEGPGGDFGQALVRGGGGRRRRRAAFRLKPWFSAGGADDGGGAIAVETRTAPGGVRVSYIPRSVGRHQLALLSRGRHIAESPYTVMAPDFTGP
ncbi:Protein of unknown function, partial [Gryllus bimaculatus]